MRTKLSIFPKRQNYSFELFQGGFILQRKNSKKCFTAAVFLHETHPRFIY